MPLEDLRARIAARLCEQADQIASRCVERADEGSRRQDGGADPTHIGEISAIARSLGATLDNYGVAADDVVSHGLYFGARVLDDGASLHQMLKGLDLLQNAMLDTIESVLADESNNAFGATGGIGLCKELSRACSRVVLSATRGYTEAMAGELQDRLRRLRHDLRNPLGTITGALSLMSDEGVPAAGKTSPHLMAIAERGARRLGETITERLSHPDALLPLPVCQWVSLKMIVSEICHGLDSTVAGRRVTVKIVDAPARALVDAAALELVLYEILRTALCEAQSGDELAIEFPESTASRVVVSLRRRPAGAPISGARQVARVTELGRRMGVKIEMRDELVLIVPAHRDGGISTDSPERRRLPDGDAFHDVRGTGEREHGHPGAL